MYTLGGLAELYAEEGLQLDRAVEFAEHNLLFRRDEEARATLRTVREKRESR